MRFKVLTKSFSGLNVQFLRDIRLPQRRRRLAILDSEPAEDLQSALWLDDIAYCWRKPDFYYAQIRQS